MNRSLIVLFLLLPFSVYTQRPPNPQGNLQGISGSISGILLDSITRSPIDYASIGIIEASTGKIINGGITDERGKFKIGQLSLQEYKIQINFIGYRFKMIEGVQLTSKRPDVELGKIILLPENQLLNEIKIVGEAALIESRPDKIVYNAERDVTSAGGDASDVLRKVPLLTVDFDGNVSMRGSENVKILINGRPSGMFSSNVGDALKMMSADQIKSVEVITSPSAKFDAEGTAGIINIITRKKNIEGISGSIDLTGGTRSDRANGNINYGKGRLGINLSGGGQYSSPQKGGTTFLRNDYSSSPASLFTQDGTSTSSRSGLRLSGSLEYNFNAFNTINSSINFRNHSNTNDNQVLSNFMIGDNLLDSYQRMVDGSNGHGSWEWNLDYKRLFPKKDKEWSMAFQLDNDDSNADFDYAQFYNIPIGKQMTRENNVNKSGNIEIILQTDYVHPFNDRFKIETGLKSTIRHLDSDFKFNGFDYASGQWIADATRTDVFHYYQNVYAGYGSGTIKIGEKMNFIGGIRLEITDLRGEFDKVKQPFKNAYTNLLPNVTLSRKSGEFNLFKISYNQRIQRPNQRYVNPFIEYNDNRDISYGNPSLLPELVHQVEIGSTLFIKGNMINASIYGRRTEDGIENILTINDLGVSESTYYNFGKLNSAGINIFGSINIGEKLSLRGGFDVNTWKIKGSLEGQSLSNSGYDYNGRINVSWSIGESIKVEGFSFFRSPTHTIQGRIPNWSMMSFGIKKELFKKRMAAGINITEPFRKNMVFIKELDGPDFYQYNKTFRPVRSFGLILSYRFGKLDFKERTGKKKANNNDPKDEESGGGDIQG